MHPEGKAFLKSTTDGLDDVLAVLSPEDLDALAGEIERRLEELIEGEE